MSVALRDPVAPVGWSLALHAVLAALLVFGLALPAREESPVILPIDAVVVDEAVLQAAGRRRDDRQRDETARQKRAAAAAEAERLAAEREAAEQREAAAQREEAARQEAAESERAEAARKVQAEAERRAEADAKRRAEQAAKADAEKKRAARERREREAREADLRARLAEEEARASAGFQNLKASYVRAIQAHVEQRWFEPPGLSAGLSCTVVVTQIPGGEVVGMRFGSCNGNAAARQSIENAVRNASPLPPPPEPALFEREVSLVFTPKESRR